MSRASAVNDLTKKRNLEGYGLKIKKYRKNAGMTADDLARALQVTVSSVRNWECGLSRPDPDYLCRMFTVLNVSPNEFFGVEGVGASLTGREEEVVSLFRSLDSRGREEFLAIGNSMVSQCHTWKLREARGRIVSLPCYGSFASAGPGDGWGQQEEAEEVFLYNLGPAAEADEVILVSGRSMEPAYHDGDRILIKHCKEAGLGGVCVFSLRGSGLVIKEAAPGRLHSQNPEYDDIIPDEEDGAELVGRVLGVIDPSMIPADEEINLYREAVAVLDH